MLEEEKKFTFGSVQAQFKFCQGKVLTIIDAVFQDKEQRKAVKDLVNKAFSEQLNHVEGIAYGSYEQSSVKRLNPDFKLTNTPGNSFGNNVGIINVGSCVSGCLGENDDGCQSSEVSK